jgi:hypothetical protein
VRRPGLPRQPIGGGCGVRFGYLKMHSAILAAALRFIHDLVGLPQCARCIVRWRPKRLAIRRSLEILLSRRSGTSDRSGAIRRAPAPVCIALVLLHLVSKCYSFQQSGLLDCMLLVAGARTRTAGSVRMPNCAAAEPAVPFLPARA